MIIKRLYIRFTGIVFLFSLGSCSLVSESGPLKSAIQTDSPSYQLIAVHAPGDIPPQSRSYGTAQIPTRLQGEAYSDKIRERDTLTFVVTDLSEESPFFNQNSIFNYGPVEVPEGGMVSIPYVGDIQVIDRTLAEVSADMSEKIRSVSGTAQPSVVRTGRIPRTANVIGEVREPKPVPLERSGITSIDALAASGGTKGAEHLYTYTLRRGGSDYHFDYVGFRKNAFPIEEGDLLTVTTDNFNRFHVMGAINRPTSLAFPVPEPTLADALGSAEGLDERRSDPSGIFVFRSGKPNRIFTFDMKNPEIIHLMQRFSIQGGDVVYVTEAPLARWNRMISQFFPVAIARAATSGNRLQD